MEYTNDEYQIYLKVKRALLLENARVFVADYLADEMGCYPQDITDEQLKKYDYDYLVDEYEEKMEYACDFDDAWKNIIENYMEDFEYEEV